MQDLPEKSMMLEALAAFLDRDVRPKIADPAIAFRVRIATHMLGVVAREIKEEDGHDITELDKLSTLLGHTAGAEPPPTRVERARAIAALKKDLQRRIRTSPLDDKAMLRLSAGIRSILQNKLAVSQPKFDTNLEIESPS